MTTKQQKALGLTLILGPWIILSFTFIAFSLVVASLSGAMDQKPIEQSMLGIPYAHAAVETPNQEIPTVTTDLRADDTLPSLFDGGDTDTAIGIAAIIMFVIMMLVTLTSVISMPTGIYLIMTAGEEKANKNIKVLWPLTKGVIFFECLSLFVFVCMIVNPVAMIGAPFMVIGNIVYLFWIGRAASNLQLRTNKPLKTTPSWLAWGHVIPLYNFVHRPLTYPRFWREVVDHGHLSKQQVKFGTVAMWFVVVSPYLAMIVAGVIAYLGFSNPDVWTLSHKSLAQLPLIALGQFAFIAFIWLTTKAIEKE